MPRLLKSQVWDDFWPANIVDADGYSVRRPAGQAEVDALQILRAFQASWQPLPGDGGGAADGGGGSWASWLFGATPPPPPAAALDSAGQCPVDRCVGLEPDALKQRLIESMPKYGDGGCCEAYVWFTAEPDLEASTFVSSCADAPEHLEALFWDLQWCQLCLTFSRTLRCNRIVRHRCPSRRG